MRIETEGASFLPPDGSLGQFISEHYWGYSAQPGGGCLEYEVQHPPWCVWKAKRAYFSGNAAAFYGVDIAQALTQDGIGHVYGIQLTARVLGWHGLSGWLSYNLSSSRRKDADSQPWRYFDHDQTNGLLAVAGWERGPWTLGGRVRYATGEPRTDYFGNVLNVTQILYAEHGFNASTFAARVTVSTLSDLYSGVVSAIGTLKGPLHGGANEAAMAMLLEIGDADHAAEWVRDALAKKKKIMGFGHREYKKGDERAKIVKQYGIELGKRLGNTKWTEISQIVEDEMMQAKGLYPNLDFPVASVYYLMDIPILLYTPIFVMSRITGWAAHIIEQLDNNRIIRPHNEYNGPHGLQVVPMEERD